jgi:hypothetical protein
MVTTDQRLDTSKIFRGLTPADRLYVEFAHCGTTAADLMVSPFSRAYIKRPEGIETLGLERHIRLSYEHLDGVILDRIEGFMLEVVAAIIHGMNGLVMKFSHYENEGSRIIPVNEVSHTAIHLRHLHLKRVVFSFEG